jgi:hypothetical protein
MKRMTVFILLVVAWLCADAQPDSVRVWNKWCLRKDTMLLFNTGNNLIQIYSPAIKAADLIVKSLDNSLRIADLQINGDTLSVRAMPFPAKGKRMRLEVMNKKTSGTIKTVSFTSDDIPALVARVGNIQGAEASRKEILMQTILRIGFPKSLYSYPYTIKEYTFKISSAKGAATIHVNGIFLTKDVLQQIKDAPEGTLMEFTDIKVTCPECAIRTLDTLKLKIK